MENEGDELLNVLFDDREPVESKVFRLKQEAFKNKVAFDISGTLVNQFNELDPDILKLIDVFSRRFGWEIIIWTNGGLEFAQAVIKKYKIPGTAHRKGDVEVLLTFDDEYVSYGLVNVLNFPEFRD